MSTATPDHTRDPGPRLRPIVTYKEARGPRTSGEALMHVRRPVAPIFAVAPPLAPNLAAVTLPDDERALMAQPVQPYLGLELGEAQALAALEGRHIRVLDSLTGPRRLDLMPSRVNVELDEGDRVIAADAG